ncbi:hypothetical protein Glove_359g42 [Diversispora epigaea]|uniref:Uncharacterized protein n=1 Tax=Diversispora epigaea TaxID=1348612 RepID=A0A397HBD1_9GLOM|nr:hypothetical protein Glove_359g42 [Diversispora epigaea]
MYNPEPIIKISKFSTSNNNTELYKQSVDLDNGKNKNNFEKVNDNDKKILNNGNIQEENIHRNFRELTLINNNITFITSNNSNNIDNFNNIDNSDIINKIPFTSNIFRPGDLIVFNSENNIYTIGQSPSIFLKESVEESSFFIINQDSFGNNNKYSQQLELCMSLYLHAKLFWDFEIAILEKKVEIVFLKM